MRIIALIPARSGSKRIPHKNIKELGGNPLLVWSIDTALSLGLPTYVSTDSRLYAEIAERAGAMVIHRGGKAAHDDATDQAVMMDAMSKGLECDRIIYLRPTTPFRDIGIVKQAVKLFDNIGGTGLRSVEEMSESAYKCVEKPGWYIEPLRGQPHGITDMPNHQLPVTYHPNGYVDIADMDITKHGKLWGDRVIGYVTPRTTEIDTPEDWERAEYEISHGRGLSSDR
uniref:Putative cytidylyltransferase n=1 Tax=viral metagenome TaxID=1070528 RepID=A0A6M3K1Y7_9ZZZZ